MSTAAEWINAAHRSYADAIGTANEEPAMVYLQAVVRLVSTGSQLPCEHITRMDKQRKTAGGAE